MTTAEKRAQLEAEGASWPTCTCHDEPMTWQRIPRLPAGGRFTCTVKRREWQTARREKRRQDSLCVDCGTSTESFRCRKCADRHATHMASPSQYLHHLFAQSRYRSRQRTAEGFWPTGVGLAAFAAWTKGPDDEG